MYMFTLNVRLNANMYITHKKSYPNQLISDSFWGGQFYSQKR